MGMLPLAPPSFLPLFWNNLESRRAFALADADADARDGHARNAPQRVRVNEQQPEFGGERPGAARDTARGGRVVVPVRNKYKKIIS